MLLRTIVFLEEEIIAVFMQQGNQRPIHRATYLLNNLLLYSHFAHSE